MHQIKFSKRWMLGNSQATHRKEKVNVCGTSVLIVALSTTPHIPASATQLSRFHYYALSASSCHEEQEDKCLCALLLVCHFSVRTNAMPLVEVPRTPLPPLPKLGEK